ncbi:protein kinase domain-containing protein [Streptomyces sp. NPDC055189]
MTRQGDVLDGRYRLDSELGHGGFGTAWRAHDLRIGRPVAVKIGAAGTLELTQRLIQEAELAGNLTHPNIATIHDFGRLERDGWPFIYIVMELVPGQTFAELITRGLPPFKDTLAWTRQICAALAVAHDAGIVHRDITPANLILTDSGTVKVLDFGIAKRQDGGAAITGEGFAVGTPGFMAPERLMGDPVDGRSDLYSLGCVLMELWTGHPPFRAAPAAALNAQHLTAPPPRPSSTRSGMPPAADQLVLDLLAKDPDQRPRHARDVERRLALLAEVASAVTVTAPASGPPHAATVLGSPAPGPPNAPTEPNTVAPSPPHSPAGPASGADPVRSGLRRRLDQIVALPPDADPQEFLDLLDALIPDAQRELGPDDPLTAEAMLARAVRSSDDRLLRIVPKLTRVFGPEDRRTIEARALLFGRLAYDGVRDAFPELKEVIALAARVLGPCDPVTLRARLDLAEGRTVTRAAAGPVHMSFMPVSRADSLRRRAVFEPLLPDLARGLPDTDMARYEAQVCVAIDSHLLEDHAAAARHYDALIPLFRAVHGTDFPIEWALQHAHSVGESGDPERAVTMLDELLPRVENADLQHRARRLLSRFKRRARRASNGTSGRRSWFG